MIKEILLARHIYYYHLSLRRTLVRPVILFNTYGPSPLFLLLYFNEIILNPYGVLIAICFLWL